MNDEDGNDEEISVGGDTSVQPVEIAPVIPEFGDIRLEDDATCTDWALSGDGTTKGSTLALNQIFANKHDVVQPCKR